MSGTTRDDFLERVLKQHGQQQVDVPDQEDDGEDQQYKLSVDDWLGKVAPCASRPRKVSVRTLKIRRPGKRHWYTEYFGFDGEGDNSSLVFIMGSHRVWEFTVTGRNMERMADYLKEGRLDWIRMADRDI